MLLILRQLFWVTQKKLVETHGRASLRRYRVFLRLNCAFLCCFLFKIDDLYIIEYKVIESAFLRRETPLKHTCFAKRQACLVLKHTCFIHQTHMFRTSNTAVIFANKRVSRGCSGEELYVVDIVAVEIMGSFRKTKNLKQLRITILANLNLVRFFA